MDAPARPNGVLYYILSKLDSLESTMLQHHEAVSTKVNMLYADHEARKAQKAARQEAWRRTFKWMAQAAIYVIPVVVAALLGVQAVR